MRRAALLLGLVTTSLLSAEVRIDQPLGPVQFGAAPARQEFARVASDGPNFFAVWRTRTASNTVVIGGGRLSPSGELLDRPSILIAAGTGLGNLDVVFAGGNFLVVYQSGTSVIARRVSREGRLVDQQPLVISNAGMPGQLATNGDTVLLLTSWKTFRMLAADGAPLGADRVIPNAGVYTPSVTSNGSQYLIAYASDYSSRGSFTILNPSGDVVLSKAFPIPEPFYISRITATSNGSSFLMALAIDGRIACMAVDSAGNAGPLRKTDNQSGGAIVATWSGSDYTLAWAIPRPADTSGLGRILAVRVDVAGLPLDTTPVPITTSQYSYSYAFAIASNGRDTIIITGDLSYPEWRTSAAIFKSLPQIDAEPEGRRHAAIASSAPEQTGGSIASNGTLSLVTWRERAGFETVVRAAFIAADGQLGAPIDLGEAHPLTATATASNGRDFLVAYYDTSYRLVARRVTLEGVLDPTPIVITIYGTPTDGLAAGWSGQAYVVVTTGYNSVTISGLTADGTLARSPQGIDTNVPADSPAVSCAANGCSVTWHRASPPCYVLCAYTENNVFARTDAIGNLVAQAILTNFDFVTPALSLAASDGKSLFVYSFLYLNGKAMFAGRITAAGVVLDTPAGSRVMTSETSFALQPVAVVNSGLYFVEPDDYTSGRLYWTRIEPEPTPHVTSLVNLHLSVILPITLAASARNTYLVYSQGADDEKLMAPRLFLRTLASPDPQPSPGRKHAAH
jgi:hypothetical protein